MKGRNIEETELYIQAKLISTLFCNVRPYVFHLQTVVTFSKHSLMMSAHVIINNAR